MALTRASKKSDVRSPSKQQLTIFLSYRRVIGLAVGDAYRLALFLAARERAAATGEQQKRSTSANMCEHSPRSGAYVTRQLPVISTG